MTLYLAPLIIEAASKGDANRLKELCSEYRAVVGAWGHSDALILSDCVAHVAKMKAKYGENA